MAPKLQWPIVTELTTASASRGAATGSRGAAPAVPRRSPPADVAPPQPLHTPLPGPRPRGGPPADVAHPQTTKSFVRRAGRTTAAQARAFEDLGPRFVVPYAPIAPIAPIAPAAPAAPAAGAWFGRAA